MIEVGPGPTPEPGLRYRFHDGAEVQVIRVSPGNITAWPDNVDVEYIIEAGTKAANGKTFCSTVKGFTEMAKEVLP